MSILNSNNSEFVSARITQKGRNSIAKGNFKIEFFQIGDSEFDYNDKFTTLTGFTNHQMVMTPFDKESGVKYPYKLDDSEDSINYGIPIMNSKIETIRNIVGDAGFVGSFLNLENGTSVNCISEQINVTQINGENTLSVGTGFTDCNFIVIVLGDVLAQDTESPYFVENNTSLIYRAKYESGVLTLDRNMPDLSSIGGTAEVICLDCYTGELNSQIPIECLPEQDILKQQDAWMMNIVWTTEPIGHVELDGDTDEQLSGYTSNRYVSTKEYFGYTSDGQRFTTLDGNEIETPTSFMNSFGDTVNVLPKEQRTIAILHYSENSNNINNPEMLFKYDDYISYNDDTFNVIALDRNGEPINDNDYFEVYIPFIHYHRSINNSVGQIFKMDDTSYYLKSKLNQNHSELFRYLIDESCNKVGKVFPHSKIIIFDDQEIVAMLDYRSNRRFTLDAPKVGPIPNNENPNTSIINGSIPQTFWVTYMFTNDDTESSYNYLPCNYFIKLEVNNNVDECSFPFPSNIGVQFGPNSFKHMKTSFNDYPNGFLAKKFKILIQETTDLDNNLPLPDQWIEIDFTSQVGGSGPYLNPQEIVNKTYIISNSIMNNNGVIFDLEKYKGDDYLNTINDIVPFGDEQPFPGSIRLIRSTDIEELNFLVNLPTGQFETTQNPTYNDGNMYFTEVALLDKNKDPLVMGKLSIPIKRIGTQVVAVKLDF
jgi:hypothetical protein